MRFLLNRVSTSDGTGDITHDGESDLRFLYDSIYCEYLINLRKECIPLEIILIDI